MIKKFLTVLVLGLAVFAISCSKEEETLSDGEISVKSNGTVTFGETGSAVKVAVTIDDSDLDNDNVAIDVVIESGKELDDLDLDSLITDADSTMDFINELVTITTSGTADDPTAADFTSSVDSIALGTASDFTVTVSPKTSGDFTAVNYTFSVTFYQTVSKTELEAAEAAVGSIDDSSTGVTAVSVDDDTLASELITAAISDIEGDSDVGDKGLAVADGSTIVTDGTAITDLSAALSTAGSEKTIAVKVTLEAADGYKLSSDAIPTAVTTGTLYTTG